MSKTRTATTASGVRRFPKGRKPCRQLDPNAADWEGTRSKDLV